MLGNLILKMPSYFSMLRQTPGDHWGWSVLMEMKLVCPYWNNVLWIEARGAKFSSFGQFTFAVESSPGIEGKLLEIVPFPDFCLFLSSFPSSWSLDHKCLPMASNNSITILNYFNQTDLHNFHAVEEIFHKCWNVPCYSHLTLIT